MNLAKALAVLGRGGLVAFPTETVYGLGADASNDEAVRKVFEVKGRPLDHPLIVHLGDGGHLDLWARDIPNDAHLLADTCWPGPLTMVLHRHPDVSDVVTGGRDTVGLRVPNHPVALELLRAFGGGLAAPSANRFGRVSPTTAAHVHDDLGDDVDLILDGGPCEVGVESTIIELTGETPTILRIGGVSVETIEEVLGRSVNAKAEGPARAPGMLEAHYAPRARIEVVEADGLHDRVGHLLVAGRRVGVLMPEKSGKFPAEVKVLIGGNDAATYARRLYTCLREADSNNVDVLVVVPPTAGLGGTDSGLAAAVIDRLNRAAVSAGDSEA